MNSKTLLVIAALGSAAAGPALAHHAFNMYDNARYLPLSGTVKSWDWKNPHVYMVLETSKPDGASETWNVELSSPNIIGRKGWTSKSLKVGDKISKLTLHPMKDGSNYGLMVSVVTPSGETLKDKD